MKESRFKVSEFEKISETNKKSMNKISQCFQLLPVDDEILVAAGDQGVYRLRGKIASLFIKPAVLNLQWYPALFKKRYVVFVGLFNGLAVLRRSLGALIVVVL
jgi:hypothetical protein